MTNQRRYSKTHEWVRVEGDVVVIGITAFAVEQLGDIVFVELPSPGTTVEAESRFGDIESVKAVSELYSPVSGEVTEANGELQQRPELVNEDPFGAGWMLKVRPADPSQVDGLMNEDEYQSFAAEQA